jgi:hypothetical protein
MFIKWPRWVKPLSSLPLPLSFSVFISSSSVRKFPHSLDHRLPCVFRSVYPGCCYSHVAQFIIFHSFLCSFAVRRRWMALDVVLFRLSESWNVPSLVMRVLTVAFISPTSPNLVSIPQPNQTRTLIKDTHHVHGILYTMCRQSTISSQESVTIPPGFWIFTQSLFPLFVL